MLLSNKSSLSFPKNSLYVLTLALGFILKILSFATSTLDIPIVLCVAIICLFMFVTSTLSLSTSIKAPIPALASASTTNEPTPPIPKIAIFELFNFSTYLFRLKALFFQIVLAFFSP